MGLVPALCLKVKLRPLLACAAAASTCACASVPNVASLGPPPIDQSSPVAQQVAAASNTTGPFPRFQDIPNAPRDVRPVRAWSASIYDTLRLRRQLIVEAAVAGPPATDTQAFYDAQRNSAAAPAQQARGADFTAGARERATPPSPAR
jgi:hypothetical protein